MQRDPLDPQINRLRGFRPETLADYDNRLLPEIVSPPRGYDDVTTFYQGIKQARQIQEEYIQETQIFESVDYAIVDDPQTSEDVVAIMQARNINAYSLDSVKTPREAVENNTVRHWEHLLRTLPRDSKISFTKGLAIVDFGMKTPEGLTNNGTMILDLQNGTEQDGYRILNFLQTGQNGTISPTEIFQREDIEVRFKEEFMYVRFWEKIIGKTKLGSAGVMNGKNRINVYQVYKDYPENPKVEPHFTDIPLFFHEFSHIKDRPHRHLTQEEYKTYLSAHMIDRYLPLSASVTTLSAMMGTALPWTLLFTGGLITMDRILHKMSRDPNTEIGRAFLKGWQSEVEARYSQKIAADLMVENGFTADTSSYRHILDLYQPNTWRYVDQYSREAEKALKKRLPQPIPQPASVI